MTDNKRREQFTDELAQAMNQVSSGKAWWPSTERLDETAPKNRLKLVTDNYLSLFCEHTQPQLNRAVFRITFR